MLHLLKRHPVSIEAHFDFVLVLTYAFEKKLLEPLLAPGLELDTFKHGDDELAFVAVALVQTNHMRPRGLPEFISQEFFLAGYRVFVRYKTRAGRRLRGLYILRSDADKDHMVAFGNLLTHYKYHKSQVTANVADGHVVVAVVSDDGLGNLSLTADTTVGADYLPTGTPFATVRDALKFAGPMPFTFDYERETNSIIRVEGVRQNWHPRSVAVKLAEPPAFFEQQPFAAATPILCSAFFIEDIPYYWKTGITEKVLDGEEST
ncbi:MAG: DUF2071 domain-containing protein [Candidatus Obscuribacterales bacterium]